VRLFIVHSLRPAAPRLHGKHRICAPSRSSHNPFECDVPIFKHASGLLHDSVSMSAGHEAGEEDVQVYQEASHAGNSIYLSRHTSKGKAGAFDNTPILSPYPPLEQLQQKRLAARRHKTTFAYDFPNVFGNALRKVWVHRDASGECDRPLPGVCLRSCLPCLLVHWFVNPGPQLDRE